MELLQSQGRAACERDRVQQRLGEAVVVVAGSDHHIAAPEGFSKLLEERAGPFQRLAERHVAQLDHVAEQDDPVGCRDLLQQGTPHCRIVGDVLAGGDAEVEVGDDRSTHCGNLAASLSGSGEQSSLASQPVLARLRSMSGLSEERLAPVNGIEIAYQEIGDPAAEPLLLIMGLATQMLAWDEELCAMLADHGFRVVRFDNRDIGHSTMIDAAGMPTRLDMVFGRRATAPYLLRDMAEDTFGLMDHLGIDSAHLVGASMGGMIAQTMAVERPQRVRSLASMLSTTGNRWVGTPTWKSWGRLLASFPRDRDAYVRQAVRTFEYFGSPGYPMDEPRFRKLAGEMYDRSHNPAGILRQMHAITASGDRTALLRRLKTPTVVIHGARDPLVRPSGARATAKAIPGARLKLIEGMGHDLPRELWPTFVEEIAANAARAGHGAAASQVA